MFGERFRWMMSRLAGAIADLAADRNILRNWRKNLPLPLRVEEEGFSTILYTM